MANRRKPVRRPTGRRGCHGQPPMGPADPRRRSPLHSPEWRASTPEGDPRQNRRFVAAGLFWTAHGPENVLRGEPSSVQAPVQGARVARATLGRWGATPPSPPLLRGTRVGQGAAQSERSEVAAPGGPRGVPACRNAARRGSGPAQGGCPVGGETSEGGRRGCKRGGAPRRQGGKPRVQRGLRSSRTAPFQAGSAGGGLSCCSHGARTAARTAFCSLYGP